MTGQSTGLRASFQLLTNLRGLATVCALIASWVALWGAVSVANVASGAVVAIVISSLGFGPPGRGGIRPGPLFRFAGLVLIDLLKSTWSVAYEILTPTDHTDESIVAVAVPAESRSHLLLLVVAVTLTPGTAVVDTDRDNATLYLHLLHHTRAESTAAHLLKLAELACRALPDQDRARAADSTGVDP